MNYRGTRFWHTAIYTVYVLTLSDLVGPQGAASLEANILAIRAEAARKPLWPPWPPWRWSTSNIYVVIYIYIYCIIYTYVYVRWCKIILAASAFLILFTCTMLCPAVARLAIRGSWISSEDSQKDSKVQRKSEIIWLVQPVWLVVSTPVPNHQPVMCSQCKFGIVILNLEST